MSQTRPTIDTLLDELQDQLHRLRELHTVVQTQSLILQAGNFEQLPDIIRKREALVKILEEQRERINRLMGRENGLAPDVKRWRSESVNLLKEEGLQLIERIAVIDKENRVLLEGVKLNAIQASRQICQDLQLRHAYGPPPLETSSISVKGD
ncbi:MAG: flagellar export chaperone FlgN [Terriglobia bacterium]